MRAAGVLAVAVALSSCGGGHHRAAGNHPAKTTSTTSTTVQTSVTSTSSGPAGSSPTTSLQPSTAVAAYCQIGDLSITAAPPLAGLGHEGVAVRFRNVGSGPCRLYGYPGVAGLNGAGAQEVEAARSPSGYLGGLAPGATTPPIVVLQPGQTGSAEVEGTDNPVNGATSCSSYPALLVTPPGLTESVHVTLAMSLPGCTTIEVHPVVPGATGSSVTS